MTEQHPSTLSAQRTMFLLRGSLFTLMLNRPFEKISLTDICRHAMVPRSTFYRYFSDKYDLLNHSFDTFAQEIGLELDIRIIADREQTAGFFLSLFQFLQKNKATYRRLMISHHQDSVFESLLLYLDNRLYDSILSVFPGGPPNGLPVRMFSKIAASFIVAAGKSYLESDEDPDISLLAKQLSLCANDGFLFSCKDDSMQK